MISETSSTASNIRKSSFDSGKAPEYAFTPCGKHTRLDLNGTLKNGWAGRLAAAMAHHNISIIRGSAVKTGAMSWRTFFELEANRPGATKLTGLDIVSIVEHPQQHFLPPAFMLSDYRLEPSERHGGTLYAEITGADQIGFLGEVLRMLSFYSLFPVEMEIESSGRTASDRFWLKSIGNVAPRTEDIVNIREHLTGLRQLPFAMEKATALRHYPSFLPS